MSQILTVHMADLAGTLRALRERFRLTARAEVARAVGDALRELSRVMICGPDRLQDTRRPQYSAWEDPGEDDNAALWDADFPTGRTVPTDAGDSAEPPSLRAAVVVGLGAARWGFVRSRQLVPALLIGLLAALAALAGGPAIEALLGAWTAANDLLTLHDPQRRN